MTQMTLPVQRGFGETTRTDAWWTQPLAILIGLLAFVVYASWCAFQGQYYYFHGPAGQNYLSPFFSPLIFEPTQAIAAGQLSGHAWFSGHPAWWPAFLYFSPAFLILWAPAGFRFTCYGFRGHYYKGFWADPPNCAVGEPGFRGRGYRGERWFPLVLQNVHRYFMYVIVLLLIVKTYDTYEQLWFYRNPANHAEGRTFGLALGTLILLIEPVLLVLYVGGCHSLRHLVGGGLDELSRHAGRKPLYDCVSCLNRKHMIWGWASLLWIMFADVYVRLCSMGVISDLVFFKL
ncbi:MAG: succinate dehydrogenase [Phycisphaerae bacterium]